MLEWYMSQWDRNSFQVRESPFQWRKFLLLSARAISTTLGFLPIVGNEAWGWTCGCCTWRAGTANGMAGMDWTEMPVGGMEPGG